MSEDTTDVTETETEDQAEESHDVELPSDHPLVKTLAAQKATIRELKAKASRLDEIEESQKSETEKFTERLSKAEAEAAAVPAKVSEALRSHLVKLHGIDKEDAELFLTATDPNLLLKQVNRFLGQSDKRRKQGNFVPREGTTNPAVETDERAFARTLFGGE